MKRLIYLILLLDCSATNQVKGQDLVGVWQKDSKEIGSARLDCYHFFNNGKFIYYLNGYDEAQRLIAVKGSYRIGKEGEIFFKVESYFEKIGGFYKKHAPNEHNGWAVVDYTVKEIKQNAKETESFILKCDEPVNTNHPCYIIDDDKFYKIENDPQDLLKKRIPR